jgi:hypothetical protein
VHVPPVVHCVHPPVVAVTVAPAGVNVPVPVTFVWLFAPLPPAVPSVTRSVEPDGVTVEP